MTLSITVLGASGTYAAADTACSGYLLRTETTSIWLDCGAGTLANLQRHVAIDELDGIVCTHSHPDHWLELPVAVNAVRYMLDLPDAGIPVYLTAETSDFFGAVSHRPPEPCLIRHVIDETCTLTIGDVGLRFSRTDHPVETLAVRADSNGHSIAYTADTGNGWELASLGDGIDLAVVEATLDEGEADHVPHLTASQAGSQAARAGVARLLLTHLAPGSDAQDRLAKARAVFDGPVDVARSHAVHPAVPDAGGSHR